MNPIDSRNQVRVMKFLVQIEMPEGCRLLWTQEKVKLELDHVAGIVARALTEGTQPNVTIIDEK